MRSFERHRHLKDAKMRYGCFLNEADYRLSDDKKSEEFVFFCLSRYVFTAMLFGENIWFALDCVNEFAWNGKRQGSTCHKGVKILLSQLAFFFYAVGHYR